MQSYQQSTGLYEVRPDLRALGYSGHGEGLNNPALEADAGVGPIPAGVWRIGPARTHPRLGPCVMALSPVEHDAHGRSAFFIHGDNAAGDHGASHGCVILAHSVREAIAANPDRTLLVTP